MKHEIMGISQLPIGEIAGYEGFLKALGLDNPKFIRFVDTVDDIRAGEKHELVKLKPYFGLVNESHIQVFDQKGRVEVDALSHNTISNLIAKQAFHDHFYVRFGGASVGVNSVNNNNMVLSDSDIDESADMGFIMGNWIGAWAVYTSNDIDASKKGTLNAVESLTTDSNRTGIIKHVIDFATNAGNGTIRSIWYKSYSDNGSYAYTEAVRSLTTKTIALPNNSITYGCTDGSYAYTTYNNVLKRRSLVTGTDDLSLTFTGYSAIYNVCWDRGNYLYVLASHSSAPTKRLVKVNLSNLTIDSYVGLDAECALYYGLAYLNGFFFVRKESDNQVVLKINPSDGTINSRTTLTQITGSTSHPILELCVYKDMLVIFSGSGYSNGYILFVDSNFSLKIGGPTLGYGRRIGYTGALNGGGPSGDSPHFDFMPDGRIIHFYAYSSTRNLVLYKWYDAMCHTKLASPVTKTSANTMKVTYQFNMQQIF